MNWFYNLKIGTKLLTGFITVAIIAGIIGTIGIVSMNSIDASYTKMYETNTVPLEDLNKAAVAFQRVRVNILYIIINDKKSTEYMDLIKGYEKTMEDEFSSYEKTISSDEIRREYDKLQEELAGYNKLKDEVINYAVSGQKEKALEILNNELGTMVTNINANVDNLFDINLKQAKGTADNNNSSTNRDIVILLCIIAVGMIVAIGFGMFISRIISKPLNKLVLGAEKIAGGDLNVDIEVRSKDEVGILAGAFINMTDRINEVMNNINTSAEQVAAGSRQVSASSQALSQGSTEQASSIEEITASIEEVASQTKQNAVNASQANELANSVKENALSGNDEMKNMLKAMGEINQSSSNISKIIKVIDEIAFQTNILALNAAVEAARAGQHGKGFAVVAEEVRNLAARSANAAKETTMMIEGSISKVDTGTKIANDTADALVKIVDGIAKAADLVGNIAAASNEQATAISQINQAITQVSEVTQNNSATAEESAAASEELSGQADMLKDMVGQFKLKRGSSSFTKLDNFDADVSGGMHEGKMEKKDMRRLSFESKERETKRSSIGKVRISLDDKDFGKY